MYELMLIYAAISGSITLFMLLWLRQLAPALGLLDHPGGRKTHESSTPVVGGLALAIGLLPLWYMVFEYSYLVLSWGGVGLLLIIVGMADDVFDMSSSQRLLMHLLAGLLLVPAGQHVSTLGDILGQGPVMLGWVALPFTAFAVAAAVNAYNMIDGLDGLLTLVSLVPLACLAIISFHYELVWEAVLASAMISCLLAFALFNVRFPWVLRASVFMGDAGSTLVGFTIAWLAISVAMKGGMPPVVALFLIMLPLMDTAAVIWRRRLRRVSSATPGHDHMHHLLLDLGFSVRSTVLIIAALNLMLASTGLLMWQLGVAEGIMLFVFTLITLVYCLATRVPARVKQWLKH